MSSAVSIFVGSSLASVVGFAYWLVVTHSSTRETVGLATTALSVSTTIALFGLAGFDVVFIRFMGAERDQGRLLSVGLTVSAMATAICVGAFYLAIPLIAPRLSILTESPLIAAIFLVDTVLTASNVLTNAALIAAGRARAIIAINLTSSLVKLACPLLSPHGDVLRLLVFFGLAQVTNAAASFAVLDRAIDSALRPTLDLRVLRRIGWFGAAMYCGSVLNLIPDTTLPLLALDRFGARRAAYFNVCFTIANVLYQGAFSATQAMLAEAVSQHDALSRHLKRGALVAVLLVGPATGVVCATGPLVLKAFGPAFYRVGTAPLELLSATAIFITVLALYEAYFVQQLRAKSLVMTVAVNAAAIVGLALWLAHSHGLVGVAEAWLIGTTVALLFAASLTAVITHRSKLRVTAA